MGADALSDVLKRVRLTGATFFDVRATTPWVAEQAPRDEVLPRILPGARHLIAYHVVTEGSAYARRVGGETVRLETGDVIVFTNGDPHILSSEPDMRVAPTVRSPVAEAARNQLPFVLDLGGDSGDAARLVCGFLACDAQPFNPLLESLPPVMVATRDAADRNDGLGMFIQFAVREATQKQSGGESVLAKLSELMFIEVVRRHLASLPAEQTGWLAGLRDPVVGRALSLLHASPARDWTMQDVAREVGVSRSVLFERFSALVGTPPMHYLARWRMQIATGLLSDGKTSIAAIAAEVGYGSEEAFSRAFKRNLGAPPSTWRQATAL